MCLLLQLSNFIQNKAGASNRFVSDGFALSGHQTTVRDLCVPSKGIGFEMQRIGACNP